ncbi:MAG: CPBP family intramembrane metalloprotease [Bacilli bacterium]|nr:CPBP family intramembrane metalloprotease [Bacilli bacterium]
MKKTKNNNLLAAIFIFILSFFIFYFGGYIQLIPIALFNIEYPINNMTTYTLLNLFSNLIIMSALIWIFKKPLKEGLEKLKKAPLKTVDNAFKYYLLGLFGMMISNFLITFVLKGGGANNEKVVQSMISSAPIFMIISAGIIAPIIEEIVFRLSMNNLFKKTWTYVLASGLLFGSLHVISSFNSVLDLLYIIPYSSLGFAFAYMDRKENSVYPSILMHMLHNTVLTIISIII